MVHMTGGIEAEHETPWKQKQNVYLEFLKRCWKATSVFAWILLIKVLINETETGSQRQESLEKDNGREEIKRMS